MRLSSVQLIGITKIQHCTEHIATNVAIYIYVYIEREREKERELERERIHCVMVTVIGNGPESKCWTRLLTFYKVLMPLGKL